jgi:hypothetical protein
MEEITMNCPTHYLIRYCLHGQEKRFYVYSPRMTNAQAWHMAAVDAGFAKIPKYRSDRVPEFSKPKAERIGISDVEGLPA